VWCFLTSAASYMQEMCVLLSRANKTAIVFPTFCIFSTSTVCYYLMYTLHTLIVIKQITFCLLWRR